MIIGNAEEETIDKIIRHAAIIWLINEKEVGIPPPDADRESLPLE